MNYLSIGTAAWGILCTVAILWNTSSSFLDSRLGLQPYTLIGSNAVAILSRIREAFPSSDVILIDGDERPDGIMLRVRDGFAFVRVDTTVTESDYPQTTVHILTRTTKATFERLFSPPASHSKHAGALTIFRMLRGPNNVYSHYYKRSQGVIVTPDAQQQRFVETMAKRYTRPTLTTPTTYDASQESSCLVPPTRARRRPPSCSRPISGSNFTLTSRCSACRGSASMPWSTT